MSGPAPPGVNNVPSIIAVMLIAVCDPDLVHCAPLQPWDRVWETVEACNHDKTRILSDVQARNGRGKTIMGKCRLYLDEEHRYNRSMLAETPAPDFELLY